MFLEHLYYFRNIVILFSYHLKYLEFLYLEIFGF